MSDIPASFDPAGWLAEARRHLEANPDVPERHYSLRLVAAVEAARALHVPGVVLGAGLKGGRFDYCDTCSGHPAWPCPEVQAISRALLGEGDGLPSVPQILAWLRAHQWREGTTGPAGTLWLPPHGQPVGIPGDGEDRDLVRAAVKRIAERAGVAVAEVVREMRDGA